MKTNSDHAIVIGGSMGGLLAARVLADHFKRVTILERDDLSESIKPRKGVPQGHHPHGLLSAGYQILQKLFPNIQTELLAAGAVLLDVINDGCWFQNGAFLASSTSDLHGFSLSRPSLEAVVRNRVLALQNVHVLTDISVSNLMTRADKRVTGVQYERTATVHQLEADLVIDASGRGSRSPKWLEQMGFAAPEVSEVRVDMAYSTRRYQRSATDLDGKSLLIIAPKAPEQKRGGVMLVQEGDQWAVTLIGMLGDHPPTDEAGFLEFARSLPTPEIYNVIKNAKPTSEIIPFKYLSSLRRHYEKLQSFPEGYLVLGDAMCSFNPIFGQGMSVASLEAQALLESLNEGPGGLRQRFFKRATKAVDTAWMLAAGADFAFSETIGKRGPEVKFINAYIARLLTAATRDPVLTVAFQNVANMIKPPSSLFAPNIVWRVLRPARRTIKPNPISRAVLTKYAKLEPLAQLEIPI
jgi:2-polyprenyl-6-methoxyphenol hydroxylase-like FAD-dependent oxidoreductase